MCYTTSKAYKLRCNRDTQSAISIYGDKSESTKYIQVRVKWGDRKTANFDEHMT